MGRLRVLVPMAVLLVSACSDGTSPEPSALREAVLNPSTTTPVETAPPTVADPTLSGLDGLIATTDRAGLQLVDPTSGEIESEYFEEGFVTQPTWSRDGTRLVAMAFDAAVGRLLLVDPATGTSRQAPATRPYFFFSWSPDGTMIAALGPGSPAPDRPPLTTLDILDRDGRLLSSGQLEGGSLYLAWEPGGHSLLIHLDGSLLLVEDPSDPTATEELATPGLAFQAPAWVPGTRSALIVVDGPGDAALTRIDVDTREELDLGPAGGFALLAVSPDGRWAAIAHAPVETTSTPIGLESGGTSGPASGPASLTAATTSAPVELVDLETGDRTPISDVTGLWIEWNPAGDALIVLSIDLTWSVWDGATTRSLTEARPSSIFFDQYVVFSGQYIETPRLWSPDGSAVTYSGQTEAGNRFYVLPVGGDGEGTAIDLGPGHVAFWSPS
jgi:WD40 repeat protein